MLKKTSLLKPSLLSLSISSAISAIAIGSIITSVPSAFAAGGEKLEEVVVTGSRIVRRDYDSNSPIVTVEAADFETQTGLNVESFLNKLPEYNPANSPTTSQGDVQITPVNSVGIASISLRGFGPNRSLVLVDGKRSVPINALMVTDINSIPSALIQRVETITGGASAVYGADAVGGVTNFILRNNFQGLELDAQYGKLEAGDGEETRISAVMGSNFADGKGNVTIGMERYSRDAAYEKNHDIYQQKNADPNTAGTFVFLQGVNQYQCVFNCPTLANINGVFNNRPAGTNVFIPSSTGAGFFQNIFHNFDFNPDGTVFAEGSAAGLSKMKLNVDGTSYAVANALDGSIPTSQTTIKSVKWNNLQNFASAPQDRYSFFADGHYNFNDKVTLNTRATFAESKTQTLLFGTNAIFGWETTVPFNATTDSPIDPTQNYQDTATVAKILANPAAYANPNFIATGKAGAQHPVPVELAALLLGRVVGTGGGGPTAGWVPGWNPYTSLPPRSTFNTNSQWQVEGGLTIQLPVKDWTSELYASHGESATYNNAAGNLSLSRYRALTNAADYGRNAKIQGNSTGASVGFGAPTISCTSGFYNTFFAGDAPLSKDCFDAINASLQTRTHNVQDIIEVNLQGGLFNLPAGEVRLAGGFQSRRNKATFTPDILQSESSFTDQVIGVYPTGYLDAATSVKDYYGEALVPVLSGIKGIQKLELELGVRYSDYAQSPSETTWKSLVNWQVNDSIRVRGGFNRATRAPNIGELFLNNQELFAVGGNNFGDPCGLRAIAPYGAAGTSNDPVLTAGETNPPPLAAGSTTASAKSARLICEAVMGPVAANTYYNVSNAAAGGGSVFNWVNQQGNAGLKSETADTWTFGIVARSPSKNPWLAGFSGSMDWYKTKIKDAIMLNSVDNAYYNCYGAVTVSDAAGAAAQAASSACQLIPRNQTTGGTTTVAVSYTNQALIETSGVDFGVNWRSQLSDLGFKMPGGLAASVQLTVLDYYRTKQSPGSYDVLTDWKGSLGPNLSGTNAGAFDYRLFGNLSYFKDSWGVSLRWRHLPSVWSAGHASTDAVIANDASGGLPLNYTPSTEIKTASYDVFDLSANWNVNEKITLRGGISNLFNVDPPQFASTTGRPPGTNLAGVCNGAVNCVNPTSYSLPTTGGFTGGYYDTLGRSYFVGVKARF